MEAGAQASVAGMSQQTVHSRAGAPGGGEVDERARAEVALGTAPITIKPPGGWQALDVRELWHYRELVYFFVWRELKVRYKQTIFGASWAVAQPLLTMVVFSVVFGSLL